MRTVTETFAHGRTKWKVRYRTGGANSRNTSHTFNRQHDAHTFAAILNAGGWQAAETWFEAHDAAPTDLLTFGQYFPTYVAQLTGVQPRTRADYEAMHRRYLGGLDGIPLAQVTRSHVAAIVNRLDDDGRSPKTIKNAIHMLSSCLALAVEEGHLARNPVRRIRLPKARLEEHEVRFLTHAEFARLVAAFDPYFRPLVVFLVGTGLRWSEATALQSKHVDLAAGTIAVRQAWKRIPGGWEVGPPKSVKARRTVNAATLALAAAAPLLAGPNDYVFTTARGNIVRHSNFYNRFWVPACERAGLDPRPTIHALRHTHASWLISDGQSIEAIQDQLGHESSQTTRAVYAHLMPAIGVDLGKSASAALARALPDGLPQLESGERA